MKTEVFHFKAVVEKDEDNWVARCLELDLVVVADSPGFAALYLSDVIHCQLEYSFQNDNLEHFYFPSEMCEWKKFLCREKSPTEVFYKSVIKFNGIEFIPEIRIQIVTI